MAEEKKTKTKKTVKIKATTGAWWKSTSAEAEKTTEAADAPVEAKKQKPETETPEASQPPAKPAPRKPRARKSPARTKKSPAESTNTQQKTTEAVTSETETPPATEPAEKKTARKSTRATGRGRKSSAAAKTSKKKQDSVEQPTTPGEVQDDKPADVVIEPVAVEVKSEPVAAEPGAAEEQGEPAVQEDAGKKNKRKPRSRRSRKSKAPQIAEVAGQPEDESSSLESKSDVEAAAAVGNEEVEGDGSAGVLDKEDDNEELIPDESKGARKVCKLLINAEEPEECRLALLEDGRLESIHVSTIARMQTKNNIYKARIVAIEPSLQAAFVEYGREKNGFLPFSEIHPEYYKQELSEEIRQYVENHQWKKLSITDVIEKGQEVLAQVVKEEVGKKGANMTTYLSIPGRCVVLMPGSDSSGISRKISGEEKRSELRDVMNSMEMPEGIGWIVRTASVDITKTALSRDVENLLKVWSDIKQRGQEMSGVGLVYEDHQSIQRFLREHFDPSIEEILVDDKEAMEQVKAFIDTLPSAQRGVKVRLHQGARPIFNHFSVEDQIESIYQPRVNLPSGGSIVIDPTEALVAIDVNSGSTSKGKNFDASIFQANMEAAAELARQLRLRDLGGLIVVDFIDMRNKKHIQAVERQVRQAMKKDKAKVDFTRISKFGLMQISRQKLGAPIEAGNYRRCEHCQGRGIVRSVETLSLFYLRRIQTGASRKNVMRIECHFPLDVASYLQNYKRTELGDMENRYHVEILIIGEPDMRPMDNDLIYHKTEKDQIGKKQA